MQHGRDGGAERDRAVHGDVRKDEDAETDENAERDKGQDQAEDVGVQQCGHATLSSRVILAVKASRSKTHAEGETRALR